MNEAMRSAGLAAARQIKTGDRSKVKKFIAALNATPPASGSGQSIAATAGSDDGQYEAEGDQIPGENSEKSLDDVHGLGTSTAPRREGMEGGEGGESNVMPCLDDVLSVVKPARGCASGSVFLCKGEDEAMEAFGKILGTPKYGSPGEFNDEVTNNNNVVFDVTGGFLHLIGCLHHTTCFFC